MIRSSITFHVIVYNVSYFLIGGKQPIHDYYYDRYAKSCNFGLYGRIPIEQGDVLFIVVNCCIEHYRKYRPIRIFPCFPLKFIFK